MGVRRHAAHVQVLNADRPGVLGKAGRQLMRRIATEAGDACVQLASRALALRKLAEPRRFRAWALLTRRSA